MQLSKIRLVDGTIKHQCSVQLNNQWHSKIFDTREKARKWGERKIIRGERMRLAEGEIETTCMNCKKTIAATAKWVFCRECKNTDKFKSASQFEDMVGVVRL